MIWAAVSRLGDWGNLAFLRWEKWRMLVGWCGEGRWQQWVLWPTTWCPWLCAGRAVEPYVFCAVRRAGDKVKQCNHCWSGSLVWSCSKLAQLTLTSTCPACLYLYEHVLPACVSNKQCPKMFACIIHGHIAICSVLTFDFVVLHFQCKVPNWHHQSLAPRGYQSLYN